MNRAFVKAGNEVIRIADIERLDLSRLEQGIVSVTCQDRTLEASDFDAFEILMLLHPSSIEGRRLKWAKNAWAFHNLVAHPLMQVMVWLGFKKQAIRLHDATVPRPIGVRAR
jgi:hypothetical protein